MSLLLLLTSTPPVDMTAPVVVESSYPKITLTLADDSTLTFEDTGVITAEIIEQCDPISATLPIGELRAKLYDSTGGFDIFDSDAVFAERKPIEVYENIDGTDRYLGRYYLDTFKVNSQYELDITGIDAIGVMEATSYNGWISVNLDDIGDILDDIFEDVGITYELPSYLSELQFMGIIEAGTAREALQQLCFAAGLTAVCSRRNTIELIESPIAYNAEDVDFNIGVDQKFMDQPIDVKPIVTGIEITAHDYTTGDEDTTYISKTYGVDDLCIYRFEFDDLIRAGSVGGDRNATIEDYGPHYIEIDVFMDGSLTVSVYYINEEKMIHTFTETEIASVTRENKLTISDATLVNSDNVDEVLARLRDYYRQRYVHEFTLVPMSGALYGTAIYGFDYYGWAIQNIQVGKVAAITTIHSANIRAVIEKITLNLTGGFLMKAETVGVKIEA